MMTGIIICSILIGVVFITAIIYLISMAINFSKKETEKGKAKLKKIIVFTVLFFVLSVINIVLISMYVYANREKLMKTTDNAITKTIDYTAEKTAQGLSATAANLGKYYDKSIIERFKKLDIAVSSASYAQSDNKKVYTIELVFTNNNPAEEKIYLHNLIENNYLVACDAQDFVYDVVPDVGLSKEEKRQEYIEYNKIPVGKTRHKIIATVADNVNINSLRFLDRVLPLTF